MRPIQNPSQQQTLQQKRAAHAWGKVEDAARKNATFRKEYTSIVRSLPAMIITDGLGQALAFLLAKAKNNMDTSYGQVYSHLSSWVASQHNFAEGELLPQLLTQSSAKYRQFTIESLAYVQWLKRFTEAYVREE